MRHRSHSAANVSTRSRNLPAGTGTVVFSFVPMFGGWCNRRNRYYYAQFNRRDRHRCAQGRRVARFSSHSLAQVPQLRPSLSKALLCYF